MRPEREGPAASCRAARAASSDEEVGARLDLTLQGGVVGEAAPDLKDAVALARTAPARGHLERLPRAHQRERRGSPPGLPSAEYSEDGT